MLNRVFMTTLASLLLSTAAIGEEAGVNVTKDVPYGTHSAQLLDLYVPATISDDMPLLVLSPTNSSWRTGMKDSLGTIGPVFAQKGAIVVVPGYRLAPDALFPNFVNDTARAVAWSLNQFPKRNGDPRALFIGGDGDGAYIAALIALDEHYLADEGVPADSVAGFIGIAGTYLGGDDCYMRECRRYFPEEYRAVWSAPDFVDPDDPPMLLITGEKEESEGIDELARPH